MKDAVAALPHEFGVFGHGVFPAQQDDEPHGEQRQREEVGHQDEQGEHHEMSPVVDAAVDAAFVVLDDVAERTIDQNADVVTEKIEGREHDDLGKADDAGEIEHRPDGVETQPDEQNIEGAAVFVGHVGFELFGVVVRLRDVIGLVAFEHGHRHAFDRENVQQHDSHHAGPKDVVRRDAEGHGGCDDADKVAVVGQIDKKRAEKYGQTDGKFDQIPFEHGRHRHGYLLIIIEWIVSRLGRRHIVFIRCSFILAYFLDKIYKKSKK